MENNIYKEAIEAFGIPAQVDMLIEEMAELTQALLKVRRSPGNLNAHANLHEEFADVEIVMAQIKLTLSENHIEIYRAQKLKRLQERIDKHNIHE